jgi:hypothetical protein
MTECEAAKGDKAPVETAVVTPGTWRWLCVRSFTEGTKYERLDKRTQHFRR